MKFDTKTFSIPALQGISETTIREHLGLYEGYVKHANLILDELQKNDTANAYAAAEMQRRFSFEFDGMRNHEVYFSLLEGGAQPPTSAPTLSTAITHMWGSFDTWFDRFKTIAKTRGIGWAILYYDPVTKNIFNTWVDEQHLGHLTGCTPIVAIDMWEHSFVADYQPSGKGRYVDDFFANVNWSVAEQAFVQVANK